MAQPTYTADCLVLNKTKLGETDLILTCLAADGQQLRFVAKGARKPSSSFSSRLELYAVAHVLLARGKSLDICKEARLVQGNTAIRRSLEKATAAAPMAQLLARVSQDGLENPKLYDMTLAALECMEHAPDNKSTLLCAAHLLKTFAFCGLAPSLHVCVGCGSTVAEEGGGVRFSFQEGGVVCASCKAHVPAQEVPQALLQWADLLLHTRFADIAQLQANAQVESALLALCQSWNQAHLGSPLKALDFLITFAQP
ncbi:MAG: DNA repair protein RecO [Coriobacteriia bacterium]|nr:DNA repair protein RecO [Coriobacteriia bacterium]